MSGVGEELPDLPHWASDALLLVHVADHLLGPIEELLVATHECFAAYTAPEPVNVHWQRLLGFPDSNRDVVASSPQINGQWGTLRGIHALASALLGDDAARIEVSDNGGAAWTNDPHAAFPALGPPTVQVRAWCADPGGVDQDWLGSLLRDALPVHVALQVTVAAT